MNTAKAVIVSSGMLTPYGHGVSAIWDGLVSGVSAIGSIEGRFSTSAFKSSNAALISGLEYHGSESLVMQMLLRLLEGIELPEDTRLYLATTKGEIDLLEMAVLNAGGTGRPEGAEQSSPAVLLDRLRRLLSIRDEGAVISAACASSTAALAMAASDVHAGRAGSALVVACDSVTEFVYSGFSSLMAIDADRARPFDAGRAGLSVGEAAAYALVTSPEEARSMGRRDAIGITGWGMSSDANHMTGPSRDGQGLWGAISRSLDMAGVGAGEIGAISAHGTGTVYNDSMEMKAFKLMCDGCGPRPVYSLKGGMGHSMGAAGLVEAIVAGRSLYEGLIPPTVGLREVDQEAAGWVWAESRSTEGARYTLTTNSGFGGINAALVLEAAEV